MLSMPHDTPATSRTGESGSRFRARMLRSFDEAGRQINVRYEYGVSAHLHDLDSTRPDSPG